jgi:hypothetical protein
MRCSDNVRGVPRVTCGNGVTKDPTNFYIPRASKAKCLRCRDASLDVYCNEIDKIIPRDYLSGNGLTVALVGAKASGKSNYIGVLVNEIKRKMSRSFNCSLNICCSEESKRFYDDNYYKPLFVDGYAVSATNSGEIPPMLFPLNFMDNKNRIKNSASLTFYDTAGENMDSADNMRVYNRYIPNADGIILLLDPLQLPTVRRKLEGKMDLPEQNSDVIDVLSRIVTNIREVKNIKGNIKTPLAVTFTKIDALIKYGIIEPDSVIASESEHLKRGVFVQSDFESINIELRDLIENWEKDEMIQYMKNFEKYSFFGVSSLGDVPNGFKLSGSTIKPLRVLDPLLWLLAENNYIKKVKN